jgi:hypothetical protein
MGDSAGKTCQVLQPKPPLAGARGGFYLFSFYSSFRGLWDHVFEQDLKCHGMTATQVGNEKLAVTLKDPVIELYFVGVVIAIESKLKLLELKSIAFFGIALGFLNLADHPIVHDFSPFL